MEPVEFRPEAIFRDLKGHRKQELLHALCEGAAEVHGLDPGALWEEVWKRETLASTNIGLNVSIPHCRLQGIARLYVAIALWPQGIDFGPPCDEPIHIAVLVVAPADKMEADYLSLLAFLARVLRKDANREFLLKGAPDQVVAWLEENAP